MRCACSKSRGDSVQGELLRHVVITLGDGEGWEPIGGVLRNILFPSIAVIVGGSSRSLGSRSLGRPVLKLNTAAAFRCVRRLGGSDTICVSGWIALKTHAVFAEVREVVSVPVTVFVCRGDPCRSGLGCSMPAVEIGGAEAVCRAGVP